MLEVKVIIDATALIDALNAHTAALLGREISSPSLSTTAAAPAMSVPPVVNPAPAPNPVPVAAQVPPVAAPTAPVAAAPAPVTPVPNVPLAQPPQYTIDQIMAAGTTLLDAGKIEQLQGLLHSFGVPSVTDLKPEQYGAFATAMRNLGAKI